MLLVAAAAVSHGGTLQAAELSWNAGAGVVHRRLVERTDDGARLLEETGPMARLRLEGRLALAGGGALRLEGGLAGARLDYDGQTQAGAPIASTTGHRDLTLALGWRPSPGARWGEGWLELEALHQRRRIAGTAAAAGLDEDALLLLPGVRWQGPAMAGAGWTWQPTLALRASVQHRLQVDYGGGFDASRLRGGRRRELVLGVSVAARETPWRFELEWAHARQSASPARPLLRGRVAVGTVRQPRLQVDDLGVRATRAF